MNKKILIAILIIGAVFLGGFVVFRGGDAEGPTTSSTESPSGSKAFEKGSKIPNVSFVDFEGNSYHLSSFEGKVVVLDYWAAWCPYCVEEMPVLQEADQKYEEVVIIGIHRTDTESKQTGLKFAEDRGVKYLLVTDSDGSLYEAAGGFGMPVAVYIDKDGIVREVKSGPKTKDEIEEKVQELLKAGL